MGWSYYTNNNKKRWSQRKRLRVIIQRNGQTLINCQEPSFKIHLWKVQTEPRRQRCGQRGLTTNTERWEASRKEGTAATLEEGQEGIRLNRPGISRLRGGGHQSTWGHSADFFCIPGFKLTLWAEGQISANQIQPSCGSLTRAKPPGKHMESCPLPFVCSPLHDFKPWSINRVPEVRPGTVYA